MTLTCLSLAQLEQLARIVENDGAVSRNSVERVGAGAQCSELAWLSRLDRVGVEAVLKVAIAERVSRQSAQIELVWTGPEAKVSPARDTAVVLRQLFDRAERSVLVAGYAFTNGAEIFEPLFIAMRDRQVTADLFLHIDDRAGCTSEESAQQGVEEFLQQNWPFGSPLPSLYYDPRTTAPGSSVNLHAKCVVIDERWTMLGSANFTHNAHARNIELGALIDDRRFAEDVTTQWRSLISSQLVMRWERSSTLR